MMKRENLKKKLQAGIFCLFIPLLLIQGCSSIGKIDNNAVTQLPKATQEYTDAQHSLKHPPGETLLILAFSGGGTRAAALSYGVLEELRDTHYQKKGKNLRLLDEVDKISSVSGGSFTSAYYGLYGDQIFDNFKDEFLYKDVQGDLSGLILGFFDLIAGIFSTESRTEKAIAYYDKYIFKGKTFADLQQSGGPFILINATDLSSQSQFVFIQQQFDFLCSDLSQFKVARAVAASSAVPILFPPILIKKHKDCNFKRPTWLAKATERSNEDGNLRLKEAVKSLNFYLDDDNSHYVTLLDGGITDNLGLRTLLRSLALSPDVNKQFKRQFNNKPPKRVVIIVVDASTTTESTIGKTATLPSIIEILSSVTDIQLHLYNTETNSLLKQGLTKWVDTISTAENPVDSYFIELNATAIQNPEHRLYFNRIPTSFSIEKEQADMLIETARKLLRDNPEYIRLLKTINLETKLKE